MKTRLRAAQQRIDEWFEQRKIKPFAFQKQAWQAFLRGQHGLIHAPTGMGKTLAAFLGPVMQWMQEFPDGNLEVTPKPKRSRNHTLQVLWITPLRALSNDTAEHLQAALEELHVPWLVEKRTGDVSAATRSRQKQRFPEVLVITPESLSLLLTYPETREKLKSLRGVIVDEWHELLGSKRGIQTELALARIRQWSPTARIWGLSATIGNLKTALHTLVGPAEVSHAQLIDAKSEKKWSIESIIPENIERFPWAGHLGTRLAAPVAKLVLEAKTSLVFTNTRSQTEFWYRALLQAAPELAGQIAVHHGSIDRQVRSWIENQLRVGKLRCCVATSSLDLGVDFSTVDLVVQIGSPKGIARMLQRAGRSGHQPGMPSRIRMVPTNAWELVEFAALRVAVKTKAIESRPIVLQPLDVLSQHLITIALGGGFVADELLAEVRTTAAYAELTDDAWQWALDFAVRGGETLKAYDDFHRLELEAGRYVLKNPRLARLHRMSVGTIVSDASIKVRFLKGKTLGTVEESFISRMQIGDSFLFGGRLLKLERVHDNTAWVTRGQGTATAIPRWYGGRLPLSSELSLQIRKQLRDALEDKYLSVEMRSLQPIIALQREWSTLPRESELLIERTRTRFGHHLFIFPFAGRLAHEGLAALFALRISRIQPITIAMAMNDYGLVLVSKSELPVEQAIARGLFSTERLRDDIMASVNATELTKRQFREVARIAGLIFQGYPGQPKSGRHLQASSNLYFDVFQKYDPVIFCCGKQSVKSCNCSWKKNGYSIVCNS